MHIIKFKNFKPKQIIDSLCNGNCQTDYNFLTLDKEGRCLLKQRNLKQIKRQLVAEKENIVKHEITKDSGYNYPELFKKGVATYAAQNLKVKNCFICRYHAENNSWQYFKDTTGVPIFCKYLKIKCNSNKAVDCEYFKLENNYMNELLELSKQYETETKEYYTDTEENNDDDNWAE